MKTQRERNIDRLEAKLEAARNQKDLASLAGSYYGKSLDAIKAEIDALELNIHNLKNRHNCG